MNSQQALSQFRRRLPERFFRRLAAGFAVLSAALLVAAAVPGESLRAQTEASHAPSAASNVPAEQPPKQAIVSWDSRVLQIEASNSSLEQILRQVAANTGAKLEGLTHDERIFGTYGPGPACDVLSELLEGSGYNVLMVGSHDTDAPLRIVLSARLPPSPQTAMSNRNRNSPDSADSAPPDRQPDYSAQTHPQQNQNPFANGESPRDPVKFMDEILHRQQRIDEQQEQQKQQQEQQNNLLQ